jgi:hypothetical protein
MKGYNNTSSMNSKRILQPYEEIQGRLTDLAEESGALVAAIGRFEIRLPLQLKSKLEPFLGRKIALLRTDLAPQDYRYRLIKDSDGGSDH